MSTTQTTARPARHGLGWAGGMFALGVVVSVAANVADTYYPDHSQLAALGQAAGHWHPQFGAQIAAAFFPLALLGCVELLARVAWPHGWWWTAARYGGTGTVAAVAAVISYRHMSALLAAYGEDRVTAHIGPLAVDGLMVAASFALLAISHGQRQDEDQAADVRTDVRAAMGADIKAGPMSAPAARPSTAAAPVADIPQVTGGGHDAPSADITPGIPQFRSSGVPQFRDSAEHGQAADVRPMSALDVRPAEVADMADVRPAADVRPDVRDFVVGPAEDAEEGRFRTEALPAPGGLQSWLAGEDLLPSGSDDDLRARAVRIVQADPDTAGTELARALGVSDRHGRRLKNEALALLDN